jgi:hypothetical protein
MLSTLFGKKATKPTGNPPWDTVEVGAISVPIWRNSRKDGLSRFVFGISRPFKDRGEERFGKTYDVEHLWDILRALQQLSLRLRARPDVPRNDQVILEQFLAAVERSLDCRQAAPVKIASGRSEPPR